MKNNYSKIIHPRTGLQIDINNYEGYKLINRYLFTLNMHKYKSQNKNELLEEIKKINAVVIVIQDEENIYLVCTRFGRGNQKKWIAVPGTLEVISETIDKRERFKLKNTKDEKTAIEILIKEAKRALLEEVAIENVDFLGKLIPRGTYEAIISSSRRSNAYVFYLNLKIKNISIFLKEQNMKIFKQSQDMSKNNHYKESIKLVSVEKKDFKTAYVFGEKIPKPFRYQVVGYDGVSINAYPLYRLSYDHLIDMLNIIKPGKTRSLLMWYFEELKSNSFWINGINKTFPIILNKKFTTSGKISLELKKQIFLKKNINVLLSYEIP